MARSQNPMRRSWLQDTGDGWIAHRLKLMVSPAWRHRPIPLVKVLERIEIEHMRHAGKENGHLIVSYDQFVQHGLSRRTINPALQLGQALGLIEIRQSGAWAGDIRQPNEYRLTYVPEKDRKAPTDEWESVTNEKAKEFVEVYQKSLTAKQTPSAKTCKPPVPKPAQPTPSTSAKTDKLPVPKRELPLISGRQANGASVSPDPSEARRRERQHTTSDDAPAPDLAVRPDEPVQVSQALENILRRQPGTPSPEPSGAATRPVLEGDERALLKWLIGRNGAVAHRMTQQAFSGRMKGHEIKAAADRLAGHGLIRIETEDRARAYVALEAGREQALMADPDQVDIERWLAGAER